VCTPAISRRLKTPAGLLRESLLHHTNFPGNWWLWLDAAGVASGKVEPGGGFDLASNMIVAASSGMGVAVINRAPWSASCPPASSCARSH